MKARDNDIVRQFAQNISGTKLALLCGPNITRCEELARQLAKKMPADAERVELTIADISDDPARLNDESKTISLFGLPRYITLRLSGGEAVRATKAIEALLDSEGPGDPVFIIAPGMTDKTALAKKLIADPAALLAICYETKPQDAAKAITGYARSSGVLLDTEQSAALAALCANDIVLAHLEVDKIALYLDADPQTPQKVEAGVMTALGAENEEEDLNILIHSALNGDHKVLTECLAGHLQNGFSQMGLVRLMLMHLIKLAELRTRVDNGESPRALVENRRNGVFFKYKDHMARQLSIWTSPLIDRLIARIVDLEIQLKSSGSASHVLVEQELLTIVRKAARKR